jgi:Glycosyl hydrolases family 2, sugar binding domain/Glycosyl hydrolases family 2, TIM barrel domain/Glycosyl hydrolases family 2
MHLLKSGIIGFILFFIVFKNYSQIPLPEHPRPDFERNEWQNLNGYWDFAFDKSDLGITESWQNKPQNFTKKILVPFPWGAPLSEVTDDADIAWYAKKIIINPKWIGKKTFINIGASDWYTMVYLDGKLIGEHKGGYTPFSFEIKNPTYGKVQNLVIRVDDKRRDFTLFGKQGYGNARGIWQTIYLEARGKNYFEAIHFTPNIDKNEVEITTYFGDKISENTDLQIVINTNPIIKKSIRIEKGTTKQTFNIAIPNAHFWNLDDPFLYNVTASLGSDIVKSYFGMRKISTTYLPNTNYKYISLNNKPIYLQLALDQSYHPTGFYTFPSDEFMKNEILISKKIGLNGIRTHIKVDIPRKLYWADKLGLLVMADLPNSWGEPAAQARGESEYTLKEMIKRDYNHPAIFSWITFNETWGLKTKIEIDGKKQEKYLPETQKWVESVYNLAKTLDKSRLVEDNSICCGAGHTQTDINSWHEYLPGSGWEKHLQEINNKTYLGSSFHYEPDYQQADVPNINSECGNVWGYEGSTGDVDYSWDYHRMINTFRQYPKIAGWLYTEHHDVINEWNGYFRFDRSEKETGFGDICSGMTLNDLHSDIYISTGNEISRNVKANETIALPLYLSAMTDKTFGQNLKLKVELYGYDAIGQSKKWGTYEQDIAYEPWQQTRLQPIMLKMPSEKGLAIATIILKDNSGKILHHNFSTFIIEAENKPEIIIESGQTAKLITFEPKNYADAKWSKKQWNILESAKVNGAGSGFFEYKILIPENIKLTQKSTVELRLEISAKQLFAKDMDKKLKGNENYMLGEKAEPSQNPNAYPMTDQSRFPTEVEFTFNNVPSETIKLENDPADSRGILSWHYQIPDKKLREAGSYGYLTKITIPKKAIEIANNTREITIRMAVSEKSSGGLAIFNDKFGRYPINPTLIIIE